MKRVFSLVLVTIMVLTLAGCREKPENKAEPQEGQQTGQAGELQSGEESIAGVFEGPVTETAVRAYKVAAESDFLYEERSGGIRIKKYVGTDTVVVIPETIQEKPVTEIVVNVFSMDSPVKGVLVPSGVKHLNGVFGGNKNLEVVIWESAEEARDNLFNSCGNLHTVILGEQLKILGENTFAGCGNLEKLYIPATVTSIDEKIAPTVFFRCDKLTIHGEAGSYIESFCAEQGIPFNAV